MKQKTVRTLFLGVLAGLALILASCSGVGSKEEQVKTEPTATFQTAQSFEVDSVKIIGDTPQARADSLVSLLNSKAVGFVKIFGSTQKVTGATPEESGMVYRYTLMVYGDHPQDAAGKEAYGNKVLVVGKQAVAYTAKFVTDPSEQSRVKIQISYGDGSQQAYDILPNDVNALRTSPAESWLQFAQPVSLEVVLSDQAQEMQLLSTAFRIAMKQGYISEEELTLIQQKWDELQQAQAPSGTAP